MGYWGGAGKTYLDRVLHDASSVMTTANHGHRLGREFPGWAQRDTYVPLAQDHDGSYGDVWDLGAVRYRARTDTQDVDLT